MIKRVFVSQMDTPEYMEAPGADRCPVESAVTGLDGYYCWIGSFPFNAADQVFNGCPPDEDSRIYFNSIEFAAGCIGCNNSFKTKGFCFQCHPSYR